MLGREAVVKVLHQRLRRNDTVLQRFMREAQLASRLDHPYAAHVYQFGIEHDDGLFWIAMELVHGTPLNRWLRERGPLALDQLVPFFECVAEVVQTAHDRGIVHRDLKPSNVMVIERAGKLLPKLLDFGVAKLLDEASLPRPPRLPAGTQPLSVADQRLDTAEAITLTASTTPPQRHDLQHRLTHADSTIGSPPYMSPEQWTNAVTVGPVSDLYALAVIAYEALTGRRPFIASTVTEYADLHCNAAVPPLGDGLPPALDRLFERALAKRPEHRWQSALELAAALRSASRVGRPPAEVPALDRVVRDAWLADAPQPLADLVAGLDDAGNPHHARDAVRDLMRGLLRYLVALGLATRAQVRDERDDPAVVELLRTMRQRDLGAADLVRLLRLVVRPFVGRRGAHPIPELVDLVTPHSDDDTDDLDPLLAMQPPTDQPTLEDVVRSRLAELLPELTRVLRRTAFVLDYVLVVPREEAVERWTGPRRRRRRLATVHAGELVKHHPMLLDRKGRVCVDLWPLAQVVSPTEGAEPELFLFEGRGRHGARMIATPAGYEHFDPGVWEWIAARVIADAAIRAEAGEDHPPYLGLAPYAVTDAVRFVGREAEVDGVLERLRYRPLQVVVGPSGAGKTSFVHAGVIPRLPRGWRAVTLRPGAAPLAALASRLGDAGVATGELRELLASSPAAAAALVARAAEAGTIVVVIDQLEELFTLSGCTDEREQFAAAVAQLAASADLPVRVIATIRDDFLMQLDALHPLHPLLSPGLVLLNNPLRDDLIRIVAEPVRRAGYTLSDPELAHDMVSAVASRPGALALLSFTASRLWELRDRRFRQLTRAAYDAMGGVAGALVRHAEATFEALSAEEQRLAREIFRHLVTADGARVQLTADELRQRLATPRAAAVIDKLVAARLIAQSESQTPGESHIEVIHDALLDGWPRLQRWVREDVDGARMRDQLRIAARQWTDRGRPRSLVWRDGMLADLERWLRRGKAGSLTELETAFVETGRRLARRARLRRRLGLVAIGFAIAFAVFGYYAMRSRINQSVLEHQLTQAYADWGQEALLDGRPVEALVYLHLAARRGDDTARVNFMLARAAEPFRHEVARLNATRGRMWWASYSPDGRHIVTTDDEGAQVWDATAMTREFALHHGDIVYQATFTADGTRIVTAGADGQVKVWDATDGRPIASLRRQTPSDSLAYFALAMPSRGSAVAAIDSTGTVVDVWDLHTGALLQEMVRNDWSTRLPSLQFSRDGAWLATTAGGDVSVYDTATWKPVVIPGVDVSALSFDPSGERLATASLRGDVSIWNIPTGERQWRLREGGDQIFHAAFSPDGALLVAGGQGGVDRIWDTRTGELRIELKNHRSAVRWAEFDASSRLVVSVDNESEVAITDVALRTKVSTLDGPTRLIRAVHFDPSARHVVAASWDGTARVWDTTRLYLQWATQPLGRACGSWLRDEPDQRFIALTCGDRGTTVWDTHETAGPKVLAQLPSPTPAPAHFQWAAPAVNSEGDRAAIARDNTVAIYELPGGRLLRTVHHDTLVTTVAFAARGRDLVTGSIDGSLKVTRDGRPPLEVTRLPEAVDAAAFLADGRVVVADARPRLGIYRVEPPGLPVVEEILSARARALRLSSDGRRLLTVPTSGAQQAPTLWDLEKPGRRWQLDSHNAPVLSARFVAQDRALLTASGDGIARLWDAETGRLRRSYSGSSPYLADALFDPDGTTAVTAAGDGMLRFWDVSSGHMIWTLQAHQSAVIGIHFDGTTLVTRALTGEMARWELPKFQLSRELNLTVDRIVRCLPLRFDEEMVGLVEQDPRCGT
ncbi:MAG TPA: protein kinase [Kofleriaceae bacterium]|nr:protein kinase [Kofleriaceae bacterium]